MADAPEQVEAGVVEAGYRVKDPKPDRVRAGHVVAGVGQPQENCADRFGSALEQKAEAEGSGFVFASSTVFILPNGAKRSPDVCWIRRERWETLSTDEQNGFPPLGPDFVLELRSPSDRLLTRQDKMQEYLDNGARLGWLIDPFERVVYIYRPGEAAERLDDPREVSGEPVLAGFVLQLGNIW